MSRSKQIKRNVITDRNTILTFGKWKGASIDELLLDDPQYLVWLHNNSDFELGHELLAEAEAGPSHEFSGYTARD